MVSDFESDTCPCWQAHPWLLKLFAAGKLLVGYPSSWGSPTWPGGEDTCPLIGGSGLLLRSPPNGFLRVGPCSGGRDMA